MIRLIAMLMLMAPLCAAYSASDEMGAPVGELAGVLMRLQHFPSDGDKAMLQGIIDDKATSESVREIARALQAIEHRVTGEHRAALEKIESDDSVSDSLRELARVALSANHVLSADQKERLSRCCVR